MVYFENRNESYLTTISLTLNGKLNTCSSVVSVSSFKLCSLQDSFTRNTERSRQCKYKWIKKNHTLDGQY